MTQFSNIRFAAAQISGSPAHPQLRGTVRFQQQDAGVLVTAALFHLPNDSGKPHIFAFHIHDGSGCTGTVADSFANAGGHYNPGQDLHPNHAGDLPPLFGNDGYAYLSFFTNRFTVDEIVGRVIIVHDNPDDFTTQPSGNSGQKIACGRIQAA